MKNRDILRHTKFVLCCALFAFICVCGSAAAFADSDENVPALMDRNGLALSFENFMYYNSARDAFSNYLDSGSSIKLTIDTALQTQAEAILSEALEDYEAAAGCAALLDIKTGEPLLLVSTDRKLDPINSVFAPEQLFYPATALAALNYGIVDADTAIPCEGVFTRYEDEGIAPECWIWDAAPGQNLSHPEENVTTALRDSCQYYFYCLGNDLGIDALANYARSLGLGETGGIELPASAGVLAQRGTLPEGSQWRIGDTLEAAVGRSTNTFTAFQFARYCAAIANNGIGCSSSVIYEITDINGNIQSREAEVVDLTSTMDEKNWAAVKGGMYLKTNDALNINANPQTELGWEMPGMSSYEDNCGLFMGYAPYDEPLYAIAVAVTDISSVSPVQQAAYDIMSLLM